MRAILRRGRAAGARARDRAHRDLALADAHQDLRRGADDLVGLEVEIAQERRRVDAAQRAVEREGRQREGRLEPLRRARPGRRRRRGVYSFARSTIASYASDGVFETTSIASASAPSSRASAGERRLQRVDDAVEPGERALVGGLGRDAVARSAPARRARSRPARRRTPPSRWGAPAPRPARRARRGSAGRAAPWRAPCRSRDSRTAPPPSAAGSPRARSGSPR